MKKKVFSINIYGATTFMRNKVRFDLKSCNIKVSLSS